MNARADEPATDDVRVQVGARIRQRREKLGLSQPELGLRLQGKSGNAIAGTQISKWERGENLPQRKQWSLLADALETSPDAIFGGLFIEAPSEQLVARVETVAKRLDGLIRVLGVGDAVDAAVRAGEIGKARATSSEEPPTTPTEAELTAAQLEAEHHRAELKKALSSQPQPSRTSGSRTAKSKRGSRKK